MKKIILIFLLAYSLFGSYDPRSGQEITKNTPLEFQAQLITNDTIRTYTNIYSLYEDFSQYGIKDIKVKNFLNGQLFDADKAYYVYKSNLKPTYGKYSLIAFKKKARASLHVKNFKGKILNFEEILQIAQKTTKQMQRFMQKRYKKRAFPMGKKLFEKLCPKELDVSEYFEISDLKHSLEVEKICGYLDKEYLDALSLYLWFVKRRGDLGEVEGAVEVDDSEKCPVCGMFVYKYPKWAAQIFFKHKDHEHHFSFDGVKDMMKFYFHPLKWGNYKTSTQKNISKILVTDYYSSKAIDGQKAYYVIGSNIYGPMGHEFVPFEHLEDAINFKNEHRGVKVLKFSEISQTLPYDLDSGKFQ
jgi:nitrous oxide reductase accessory protein NosL